MERLKIYITLFVLFCFSPNSLLFGQQQNWLQGTWIGIVYRVGSEDTRKIVFKSDPGQELFQANYPEHHCEGGWEMLQSDEQKASFRQKKPQESASCNQEALIVITKISEDYVTYSNFLAKSGELFSYATLVKVDESKFAYADNIKIENNACENLYFDLEKGTLNGLRLDALQKDIKTALPCFTGDSPDGVEYNCGGGVFFLKHGLFFYSGQNYIEVRKKYQGGMSYDIMEKSPELVTAHLGYPDRLENVRKWDGTQRLHYFYATKYGCMSIVFVNRKVARVAAHATSVNETRLCY